MAKKVKVLVLRTAGTNCDAETVFAFKNFGADVNLIHIKLLVAGKINLGDYHILAFPGGFSYGDDIAAGRILANELRIHLAAALKKFIIDRKLIIGICNGFQVMVKAGILPDPINSSMQQLITLSNNDSGKFEGRWVYLKPSGNCAWTKEMNDVVFLPVAHGEGKFIPLEPKILAELKKNNQIVFTYTDKNGNFAKYPGNPNGSLENIAGITDRSGQILGLMPHPERHFFFTQHPFWTRLPKKGKLGDGARIFENGVSYVKEKIL